MAQGLSSTVEQHAVPLPPICRTLAAAITGPVDVGTAITDSAILAELFAAAPEAMLVVDTRGTIQLANARAEEFFAYAPGALVGRSVDTLVPSALAARHARHRVGFEAEPRARAMGEDLELRGRRADGTEFPIDVALGPAQVAGQRYVVAIVRDITERKLHQDELRYLSEHDALTGLLNRSGLDRQLAQAMAHARRHGVPTALLLIDLDGFKLVNDQLGHLEGDRLLCSVVQGLRERLRAGDTVARLGGDEFAVVLPYAAAPAAEMIAHDLLAVVCNTAAAVTEGRLAITASIGVVELGRPQQDLVDAIAAADRAMYDAKRAGGNAVRVAPEAARDEAAA